MKPIAKLEPLQQQTAPLRNKIIASLRTAIATGVLEPGARLVERDLCTQLNVSRTSLREALRELQADGVLLQAGARGLSVVGIVSREEAENAYRARALLEALVVEQFIERAGEDYMEDLIREGDALKAAYHGSDIGEMLAAKHRFLSCICTGARNELAFNLISRLILRTASLRTLSYAHKSRREQSLEEAEEIVSAVRARNIVRAKHAAAAHVANAMKSAFAALDEKQRSAEADAEAKAPKRRKVLTPT